MRSADEIFAGISTKAADPGMIGIAEKIIAQQEGPFDPRRFTDRYEEALRALIDQKKKGQKAARVEEPEDTNVVDLMAALRASLGGKPAPTKAPKAAAAKRRKTG